MRVLVKIGYKALSVHLVDDADKHLCTVALNLADWTIQERLRDEVTICRHCLRIHAHSAPFSHAIQPRAVFFALVTSSAIAPLSVPALCDLILAVRACYGSYNLTGILLYRDGTFMQFLEGAEADVRRMLALSALDPDQLRITPVLEGFTAQRQYADWSMAFPTEDSDDMRFIRGFSNFLNTPRINEVGATERTATHQLLLAFKSTSDRAV